MTTTEDLAAIAREVGGDRITVESIARGYQDPHFVEAKPSFILKLQKADLLVAVGTRARDRVAAAADSAEPQRQDPGGRGRLPRRLAAGARFSTSRQGRSRGRWATCIRSATRTTGSIPRTASASRRRLPTSCRSCDRTTRRISTSGWPTSRARVDAAEKRWLATHGALQGDEGGHLPPLVPELRRALRPRSSSATSSRGPAFRRRRSTRSI